VNKGPHRKIFGFAALIALLASLPQPLGKQALASDSNNSAEGNGAVNNKVDQRSFETNSADANRDSLAPPEVNLAKLIPQATLGQPKIVNTDGDAMVRYMISIENYHEFGNDLFKPATYLKPLAEHLNSSRAWVYIKDETGNPLQTFGTITNREQLKNLWFAIEKGTTAPGQVYVDIWDRQTDTHFKSASLKIKSE
jgi:hypothetical protein